MPHIPVTSRITSTSHFPDSSSFVASSSIATAPQMEHDRTAPVADEQRIRIKNRRKRYLDLHPEYFLHPDLELADPLLYDRLVRRFQSAAEREREGRARGYTGVLEADLVRSEAKLLALQHPDPASPVAYRRAADGSIVGVLLDDLDEEGGGDGIGTGTGTGDAARKARGWARWVDVMGQRFLRGDDREFEYEMVDRSEEYDDRGEEERARLEEYLEGQEEEFVGVGSPQGETGVQDF